MIESSCNAGDPGLIPGSGSSPKGEWLPIPVFLSRKSHGQMSLAAYSQWSRKVSDTTEQLSLTVQYSRHRGK